MQQFSDINTFPFFCVAGGTSATINFGVVLGLGNDNSSSSIFIPKKQVGEVSTEIVRSHESGFATKNSVTITGNDVIICLKIQLEDIADKASSLQVTQDAIYKDRLENYLRDQIKYKWTKQRMYHFFYGLDEFNSANITSSTDDIDFTSLDVADDIGYSSPISSWTPSITDVFFTCESYEDTTKFLFIQSENGMYYKYVAIARITSSNNSYSVEQLLFSDYSFFLPFWFLENIKEASS